MTVFYHAIGPRKPSRMESLLQSALEAAPSGTRAPQAMLVLIVGLGHIFMGGLKGGDVMERRKVVGERRSASWGQRQPGSGAAVDSPFFDLDIASSFECGEVFGQRRLGDVEGLLKALEIDSLYAGEGGHDGESHRCVNDDVQPVSGMRRHHRCGVGIGMRAAAASGIALKRAAPTQNQIPPDCPTLTARMTA
jgi:hypothetical protein